MAIKDTIFLICFIYVSLVIYIIYIIIYLLVPIIIRKHKENYFLTYAVIFMVIFKFYFRVEIAEIFGFSSFPVYIITLGIIAMANFCDGKFNLINFFIKTIIGLMSLSLIYYYISDGFICTLISRTESIQATLFNETSLVLPQFENINSYIAIIYPYFITNNMVANTPNYLVRQALIKDVVTFNKCIFASMRPYYDSPRTSWWFAHQFFLPYGLDRQYDIVHARRLCFMLDREFETYMESSDGTVFLAADTFLSESGRNWWRGFVEYNKDNVMLSDEFRKLCSKNCRVLDWNQIRVTRGFMSELRKWVD